MKKPYRVFKISITHRKLLQTIHNLNQAKALPSTEGVAKILNGILDQETKPFEKSSTFGILLSYHGRKLTALVTTLARRGYLTYVFEEDDNRKYLKITPLGEAALLSNETKSDEHYHRKEKKFTPTIIYK
ncbi:MAG: hypothetical protein EOM77_04425 [Bacteroidia bacterium]|nr:hypothetical protein [Bacteroidia bacterium]